MEGSIWPKDNADAIRRALATEGGHLFLGRNCYALYYAKGAINRGYDIEPMKRACLAAGLPVIDARALDHELAFALACRSPMIAVGEPPRHWPLSQEEEGWGPLAHAPLQHVADIYREAGAEVSNLPVR